MARDNARPQWQQSHSWCLNRRREGASRPAGQRRFWRTALTFGICIGDLAILIAAGRPTLTQSVLSLRRLDWAWLSVAVVAEITSMGAFARTQRLLVHAGGGTPLRIRSVMAVTYAGNAISVSLPLAGPEAATAFTFRQFGLRGIDPAVASWALAVSGIISSLAFAFVLAVGAIASGNATAAALGLVGATLSLLPGLAILGALRYVQLRRLLNRFLDRLVVLSRRLIRRPGPGAEGAVERFIERIASLHLPRTQYAEALALAIWNWVADCCCLGAAIRATGAQVPWRGLLLAYAAGMTAASIGFTPGGLGIIESALTAALINAGLTARHALAGVLVYRFISFWLVMAVGWAVMALLRRRQRRDGAPP